MPQAFGSLNLDVGLEQVIFQHEPEVSSGLLPHNDPGPSNPRFHFHLQEVLNVPASHEQRLLGALRPQIQHREVIHPFIFSGMIAEILNRLRRRLGQSSSQTDRRKIRGAAGTLEEFQGLTSLLRHNQHALRRG